MITPLEVLGAYVLSALATKNYMHHPFQSSTIGFVEIRENVELAVLEFDDDGFVWPKQSDSRPIDQLLDQVSSKAAWQGDTVVAVFVHGWHHNADLRDEDFKAFQGLLSSLKDSVKGACGDTRVLGIYIGWRGRSAPGVSDYLTIFGRKAAAERIGRGGGANLLLRLHQRVRGMDENPRLCPDRDGELRPASTSLVVAGHSLGGTLVLSAFSAQLQRAAAEVRGAIARAVSHPGASDPKLLDGLGDVAILINPATEAIGFELLRDTTQGMKFSPFQSPVLVVIAAENDKANQFWFGVASKLSTVFRARTNHKPQLRKALGVFPDHWTHCLELERGHHPSECPSPSSMPVTPWASNDLPDPATIGMAGDYEFPGVYAGAREALLTRIDDAQDPNDPFLVIRTSREILNGHSGEGRERIFTPNLNSFLIGFITESVTKRVATRVARQKSPEKIPDSEPAIPEGE